VIDGGDLYRRGFTTPLLKCLTQDQSEYVMNEMHRGIYGMHLGSWSMKTQVLIGRYYWLTMRRNYAEYVKKCKECQKVGNISHLSTKELHSIVEPWPFSIWGVYILGSFSLLKGQVKYLLIGIDYITKWIQAKPITTISEASFKNSFGIALCTDLTFLTPWSLTMEHDLLTKELRNSMKVWGSNTETLVEHPQSNGQLEETNKVILRELKKRDRKAKGNWAKELPTILWAYHCSL